MSGSFDRDDLHAPMAEINTTPLVDVLLVLLVIFLVTAPMLQGAIKVELPTENVAAMDTKESLVISIDAAGNYYLNDSPFTFDNLSKHLFDIAKEDAKQPISIRADGAVPYNKISHLLAEAANAGLVDIRFMTEVE